MSFVAAMVQAYTARGLNPAGALKLAQIAPDQVDNPNARITAAQMEAISDAAMRELDDEALGCFGRALPWGSYGMLARASLSAPTLGLALKRWCRHHGLLTRDIALSVQVEEASDLASIELRPAANAATPNEFCVVSVLRNILGFACWLVDSRIPLQGAMFPFTPPKHVSSYPVLFDGPCTFDALHAAIQFDARYLALPIRRDEAAMNQMLQHALPLTVHAYRRDRLLVQRVRQTLATQPTEARNASDLAHWLNLSPRTLHRQLKEEGASLQSIKDEVRRDRAMALLQRTRRPVKQVAEATGFQNEKSFIRAFKGWTGKTPGEWRDQG
ncbi:AraC family transcriptional regulator [Hydrogenophaga crassostreae]